MPQISILGTTSCAILMSLGPLCGQGTTLAGTGYSDPSIVHVAPGQITTLFVTGLKTVISSGPFNATTIPLPTTLAGIAVTLNQTGHEPTSVPLLSVRQVSVCSNGGVASPTSGLTADCLITAITVQIPFELIVFPPPPTTPAANPELVVSENGNVSKTFRVLPLSDNLHVINTCDAFPSSNVNSEGFCVPLVTHANGALVIPDNPVQPGEEIVIWAFGLGSTTPLPKTGQVSPTPAARLSPLLYLQFDFRPNAMPSPPYINPTTVISRLEPNFVGLTPGQVGLYQINVTIPSSIPVVDRCDRSREPVVSSLPIAGLPIYIYNIVRSNLTIDIGANASFDGAAICIQPPQPAATQR